MLKKIIIVRHGETPYNTDHRIQGWTDIPLNDNGHEQAKKVALRLSNEIITAIYASDHERAHVTAKYIAESHGQKVKKRKHLREVKMGIFEGWRWKIDENKELEKLWQEREAAHSRVDLDWKVEGAESLKQHTDRVKKILNQIEKNHADETIVLVSHGATLNRILEIYDLKSITDKYISFQNTSVTILSKSGLGYQLEIVNDISHL